MSPQIFTTCRYPHFFLQEAKSNLQKPNNIHHQHHHLTNVNNLPSLQNQQMMHRRQQNKKNTDNIKREEEEEQRRIRRHHRFEYLKHKAKGVWATNPKPNEPNAVWVASGNCEKAYWVRFTPPPWASIPLSSIKPTGWD